MNRKAVRADVLLLLTAGIWGFGFVAQRSGMEHVGPFAFNGLRFILGSLSLLPLILLRRKSLVTAPCADISRNANVPAGVNVSRNAAARSPFMIFFLSSLAAGTCLFIAVTLQQFGIMFTTAGNTGFITGLYVVFTPIFGIFLGRKTGRATWLGSGLTLTGLFFLSAAGRIDSINPGDCITVVSAVFWTFHVLIIDWLVRKIDPVALSAGQFAVCGIFSLAGAFIAEPLLAPFAQRINPSLLSSGLFSWQPFPVLLVGLNSGGFRFTADMLIPILYGGLASVGIAYTLQAVAQRDAPPAHATILLCFEGCFAALGGALLLGEKIGRWTLIGFFLMLCGMIVTQWEVITGKSSARDN